MASTTDPVSMEIEPVKSVNIANPDAIVPTFAPNNYLLSSPVLTTNKWSSKDVEMLESSIHAYNNSIKQMKNDSQDFKSIIKSAMTPDFVTDMEIDSDDIAYFKQPTEYQKKEDKKEHFIEESLKNPDAEQKLNDETKKYMDSIQARQCQYNKPTLLNDDQKWCSIFQSELLDIYKIFMKKDMDPNLITQSLYLSPEDIKNKIHGNPIPTINIKQNQKININNVCYMLQHMLSFVPFFDEWRLVSVLGMGVFGLVVLVQKDYTQRAVKIMLPLDQNSGAWMSAEEETKIGQKINENLGLAPKIYDIFTLTLGVGPSNVIVQEKLDMSAKKYIKCLTQVKNKTTKNQMVKKFFLDMTVMFLTLKECNMTHCDLHGGNVMLKFNATGFHLQPFLIDFGQFACDVHVEMYDISKFIFSLQAIMEENEDIVMYNQFLIYFSLLCKLMYPNNYYWKIRTLLDPPNLYAILLKNFHQKVHDLGFMGCKRTRWPNLNNEFNKSGKTYRDMLFYKSLQLYTQILNNIKMFSNYIG